MKRNNATLTSVEASLAELVVASETIQIEVSKLRALVEQMDNGSNPTDRRRS